MSNGETFLHFCGVNFMVFRFLPRLKAGFTLCQNSMTDLSLQICVTY